MMKVHFRHVLLACILTIGLSTAVFAVDENKNTEDFHNWLAGFKHEAIAKGVDEATWNLAFDRIEGPDLKVLERASYQPEFVQEVWEYLDRRLTPAAVERGRILAEEHMATFALLERQFGISRYVLLAIWSMESNYGAILQRRDILHYIPQALATLAWGDEKRSRFAKSQLITALKILQAGDVDREGMLGSWAGAMGHTQFIPTSYDTYAVDIDGNGKRDIWNSVPDALGTAANLLAKNGWRSGKTWGYEVTLPEGSGKYAEQTKTLAEWADLGVVRPGAKPFPRPAESAVLKVLAGENGPGFLMIKNFYVIKRYNNSNSYALAVGLLADNIAGYGGVTQAWPRQKHNLSGEERLELQRLLKEKGLYSGELDGFLGSGSRAAIRKFELQAGLQVDGLPSRKVLEALRR